MIGAVDAIGSFSSVNPSLVAQSNQRWSRMEGALLLLLLLRSVGPEIQARNFLIDKKILDLFNFLIGHLLIDEPDEPIDYLYDLLDKCILFKSGLIEPPLLFDQRHIESLYQSLDPNGRGDISIDRYRTGLNTLGICISHDMKPRETSPGRVDKETFVNEAKSYLVKMLSEMIGKFEMPPRDDDGQ